MINNLPILLIISLISGCIEVDISVPSFPDISSYFAISDGLTQMTIAVNFMGFCLSSVIWGPLSDSLGRRKIMIIGNAIMLIGAAACVFAPTIELLLLSRFIQGFGASTSAVIVFAIIADVYSSKKSSKLIGTMNSILTIFMSIAPIAGGFINELIGWRGNYSVVAIVSLLSWIVIYIYLPESKKEFNSFSSSKVQTDYKLLFTSRCFIYAATIPSICYSGYMSFIACGSFLYMETFDLPIMYYSLHQGLIIVIFSFFSMYAGTISNILGELKCIKYGVFMLLLGGIMMLIVSLTLPKSPYLTTFAMAIFSTGGAISYPIIFSRSMEIFPNIGGTASSAIMAMRALICSTFVAITSYIYDGTLMKVALMILLSGILNIIYTYKLLQLMKFDKKA